MMQENQGPENDNPGSPRPTTRLVGRDDQQQQAHTSRFWWANEISRFINEKYALAKSNPDKAIDVASAVTSTAGLICFVAAFCTKPASTGLCLTGAFFMSAAPLRLAQKRHQETSYQPPQQPNMY